MTLQVDFKLSFDLSHEYNVVLDDGTRGRVKVRVGMHRSITREDYQDTVKAEIGTVRWDTSEHFHAFPPVELVQHFEEAFGIPLVGARFTDTFEVEYDGAAPPAPRLVWSDSTWMNPAWEARCTAGGA